MMALLGLCLGFAVTSGRDPLKNLPARAPGVSFKISVSELRGEEIIARNGRIGRVHDVYFDDEHWMVRYFVADTGGGIQGRKVLISPASLETSASDPAAVHANLTREQVESASGLAEGPVSTGSHLRGAREVLGYTIEARDGTVGEVQDFVLDPDSWTITGVVVDTLKWWPGGHLSIPPAALESVDWRGREMRLGLTREQLRRTARRGP